MRLTGNVKYITGVSQYLVDGSDGEINVDSTAGPVTIILPNIVNSGFENTDKGFVINDISGTAGTNAITIVATGNTVNNLPSVSISVSGGSAKCSVAHKNEWFVITEPVSAGMSGALTANYIPKAASASALTDSVVFQNGTSIGIGTILASAKLQVKGADAGAVNYALRVEDSALASPLSIRNDGNIGVNYSLGAVSGTKLYINGGATVLNSYALRVDGDLSDVFNVKNNGNIGISVNNPNYKLHTYGDVGLTGLNTGSFFNFGANENTYIRAGKTNQDVYIQDNHNGLVGVGTTIVSAKLHVKGIDALSGSFALKVDNSAINLLSIANNGVAVFSSALDGTGSGIDNYSYTSTSGGVRTSYYSQTGANTLFSFFTNGVLGSSVGEFLGYYSVAATNRFSVKNQANNKSHIFMDSTGFVGFGDDYFAASASIHVKGVDALATTFALKVDNGAATPLNIIKARNDGYVVARAVNAAIADADLPVNEMSSYINEAGNTLIFKVKYSTGVVKTASLALA